MNFCPNCGKEVNGSHRFCPNCGAPLTLPESPAPAAQSATKPAESKYAGPGKAITGLVFGLVSLTMSFISFFVFGFLSFIALAFAIPALATSCSSHSHPGIKVPAIVISAIALATSLIYGFIYILIVASIITYF